ncbi:MAG: ATP-binding protein [Nitrospinae bacterium]|nr:ATP-binding protein [Nitrospinota bacterium]
MVAHQGNGSAGSDVVRRNPTKICSVCGGKAGGRETKCQIMFAGRRSSQKKPQVLIAERYDALRELFSIDLNDSGFATLKAKDGREAVGLYTEMGTNIDVILSDLRLPGVSGEQLAKLNSEAHGLPFVLHSFHLDRNLTMRMIKFGVDNFIIKGGHTEPLVHLLKSLVYRKKNDVPADVMCQSFGNAGSLLINTRFSELTFASSWLKGRLRRLVPVGNLSVFMRYADELLMNAYEHGNLGVCSDRKVELVENGTYPDELEAMEKKCDKKIQVKYAVLGGKITMSVKDDGPGFDYMKYLGISEDDLARDILKPSGRGIFMASRYFTSMQYNGVGNEVCATGHLF